MATLQWVGGIQYKRKAGFLLIFIKNEDRNCLELTSPGFFFILDVLKKRRREVWNHPLSLRSFGFKNDTPNEDWNCSLTSLRDVQLR